MDKFNALILAKSDSKRLPNKNTLDFRGMPMFLVNTYKCLEIFGEVYVSSDSPEILEQAEEAGAHPIIRGEDLCGETPNIPVYRDSMKHMDCNGFVAVQANSPTVSHNLITLAKKILEMGVPEVMTCRGNRALYGSIWGMRKSRLGEYEDFYRPKPEVLLLDNSVDIHDGIDLKQALND